MTTKNTLTNRLLSILLCLALLVSYLPAYSFQASAAVSGTRVADSSTMDAWKDYFLPANGNLSTENAGGVWTDKSVFTNANAFSGTGITQDAANSFLVALSAIGSSKTVTGMSSVPTDTMLVLDVSRSMNGDGDTLVDAANETIHALLEMNAQNRVGVVLYSGASADNTNDDASVLLLPLGHYSVDPVTEWNWGGSVTTYDNYLTIDNNETIGVHDSVVDQNGNAPSTINASKRVNGATYIQKGIITAMNQFTADSNSVTVQDSVFGTVSRKPIMILMSDGAPTLGTSSFTAPGQYNLGNGSSESTALAFVTQLSASYAKQKIEKKYNTSMLFYTLGVGLSANSNGTSVLNPSQNTTDINTLWTNYTNANVTDEILVGDDRYGNEVYVVKTALIDNKPLAANYVNQYFRSNQASNMSAVFQEIVSEISLQSKYLPTLVSQDEEMSGYVSFVDKLGQYMKVTDVKGVLLGNTLFSGSNFASNFVPGGGGLGSTENPTALGDELVWSIQERLGLSSTDEVRTLIGLAYQYGQLSYTSSTNFSNYIGWYADANDKFLGFWHEASTTMPAGAVYTVKSYGYLGQVDEANGVTESDMMYMTVRVRENILTGEQTVAFAIPAALLPVVTYNVTLDENNALSDLTASGATAPIRLVYEVALDPSINEFNMTEKVSAEYLAANKNSDGSVNFYSNQYEADGSMGINKVNTYSYFNPSRQNERFYYQRDAMVYTDQSGTPYTGTAQPSGTMYRSYTVYEKTASGLQARTVYRRLSTNAMASAVRDGNNWYIRRGNVHVNMDGFIVYKGGLATENPAQNLTGTLAYAAYPYVDITDHAVDDTGHSFLVGTFLGNNGKMSVVPSTGIKLTKTLAADATATTEKFTFNLENTSSPADNSTYPAQLVAADGTAADTTVKFTAGKASVQLAAGETLYIGGMTAGQTIRITEQDHAKYMVETVNGSSLTQVNVPLSAEQMQEVAFVNTDRGAGDMTITKVVTHDFGTEYQIPADKSFTITVTLSGVGTANATIRASQTGSAITSITTDASGKFTVTLKNNESLQLFDLPAGTVATVVENDPGAGFAAGYWVNGSQVAAGQVTVVQNMNVSVLVVNDYTPNQVYPVYITVGGTKTLDAPNRGWLDTDVFNFQLQRYTGKADAPWENMVQAQATKANPTFSFTAAFQNEVYTDAGSYYYRVVEDGTNPIAGITYDQTVHAFAVDVGDVNMDGQLEITAVRPMRDTTVVTQSTDTDGNKWDVQVSFTNTYSTTGSATVAIELNKLVTNESGSPLGISSGFRFALYEDGKTEPAYTSEPTTDRGFARLSMNYTQEGTYTYTLKEVVPATVPAGWSYSKQEYKVTVVVSDDGDGTLSAVVYLGDASTGATATVSANFTNTYQLTAAELPIDFVQKQLSGRALKDNEFTFEVRAQGSLDAILTGTNDADGNVNFNGTLKFTKVGTFFYDIVETSSDGNGITTDKNTYRITVDVTDDGTGALKASYTLVNAEGNNIVFKNIYTIQSVTNTISGIKFLEGRTLLNDEFDFRLAEAVDANGTLKSGGIVLETTNTHDGRFVFPAQTYTTAGTYYYLVTELEGTDAVFGVSYDKNAFVVTVKVSDNGAGNLSIESVTYTIQGNGTTDGIVFVNKYAPNPTVAQIPGNKVLAGKVLTDGQFSFELYESNAQWTQGKLIETVTNGADGFFEFAPFTISEAGSTYYLVKEVNGGKTIDGIVYDDTVFRVRVDATDNLRGSLTTEIVVFDDRNIPQMGVSFVNEYMVVGTDTVTIRGEKTLSGRDLVNGEFTFELYKANASFAIQGAALDTAVNSGKNFSFDIHYTSADVGKTFYYVVKEANAGKTINGVTYDDAVYEITVVVADNGSGGIKTTTSVHLDGRAVTVMGFANSYTASQTTVSFSGEKQLNGKDLKADEFLFDLFATDANFVPHAAALQSVKNAANGKFTFADVKLTEAKTYYFLVKENSQNPAGGISYDHSEYHITVVVKDDGTGKLYVDSKTMVRVQDGNSAAATAIRFVNSYDAKNVSIVLGGTKVLNGRDLVPGEFDFLLVQTDSSFSVSSQLSMLAVNDADGSFHFDALTFHDAGTYYYLITEDPSGALDRVTYDTTVYQVTIQVTDNGAGQLVISEPVITKKGAAGTVGAIQFNNVYTPKPADIDVNIYVDKTVVNKGSEKIGPEGFEFILESNDTGEKLLMHSNHAGKAVFNLKFTEADKGKTFSYKLYELNNHRANVTYSTKVYDVSITVSLNSSNQLVAAIKMDGASVANAVAAFENVYDFTPKDISVIVAVDKTVTNLGSEKLSPEGFQFVLKNTATGEKLTVKTNAEGVALYDLVFSAKDIGKTFTYELSEVNDGRANVTYDKTVYIITITISQDASGQLVATVKENGVAVGLVDAKFVNTYNYTPKDLPVQIEINKTVTNKGLETIGPEGFEFVLEDLANGQKKTVKTDASGKAVLDLNFVAADIGKTFNYKLYEVNGRKANVIYSSKVYNISITISINAHGELVAMTTMDGADVQKLVAAFENIYDYTPSPDDLAVKLEVNKTVINKGTEKIGPEGFKFQLEDLLTGEKTIVKSDKDGRAIFGLNFTAADIGKTYTYKVTEINDGRAYITYSQASYTVAVTITKNAENMLVASIKVNEEAAEKAVMAFENVFDYTEKKPDENPGTGDRMNMGLWVALLFVSGGCILATATVAKKKEQN